MNHIFISHNPFTVYTEFKINDKEPAKGCTLLRHQESRLQLWIEKLFDELRELFNGDENYEITFRGVETDYLDLQEAARKARNAQVTFQWEEVASAEHRLEEMRMIWEEVAQHPKMSEHATNNHTARTNVEAAFNKDFDVYVVATMSSGKSTLINAMLGTSLLPAANEATTATIARITDNDQMKDKGFNAKRFNHSGQELDTENNVAATTLETWNKDTNTFRIELEGDIKAIRERDNVRLVLTDTPGPNNSQDAEHSKTTMKHIMDSTRNPMILYILNGTQLGIQDDKNLLNMIAEAMSKGGKQSKDRFIFVVSKMDAFDPEKESIPNALARIRQYLQDNGISEPAIYPVSAEFTRLLRLPSKELSFKESRALGDFIATAEAFEAVHFTQYMQLTKRIQHNLEEKIAGGQLCKNEISSGLPAVEAMIDEYIDKYNLPHRVKRVHDALQSVIATALNEAELRASLDRNEDDLQQIQAQIHSLEAKKAKGFDALAFKERLKQEREDLPIEILEKMEAQTRQIGNALRKFSESFQEKKDVNSAKNIVKNIARELQQLHTSSTATYENIFEFSQSTIKTKLDKAYENFVMSIFDEFDKIQFPTLEKLQKSISSFSNNLNLEIEDRDIKTESVKVDSRTISTSTWYKPWTWGDEKEIPILEDKEFVYLQEYWKKSLIDIEEKFRSLQNEAEKEISSGHTKIIDNMIEFMNHDFDKKFEALLQSIKETIACGEEKEKEITSAKKLLKDIYSIKEKIKNILSIQSI